MNRVDAPARVSVVIPVFNRRDMIADAVDSALAQASAALELEVIVVDDHSTADTVAALAARYGNDVRVQMTRDARQGTGRGAQHRHPCRALSVRGFPRFGRFLSAWSSCPEKYTGLGETALVPVFSPPQKQGARPESSCLIFS